MVDRCVCVDVTFAALKRLHREEALDFQGLVDRTGCCTGCAGCEPYIRLTLKTGRTCFPVLTATEAAAAMRPPGRRPRR
ncbi:MAG: hypothetical protein JNK58_02090 [Phycisphaerae bacterium]|nr:hypothetical protein [Phycisphaerae bacterium]